MNDSEEVERARERHEVIRPREVFLFAGSGVTAIVTVTTAAAAPVPAVIAIGVIVTVALLVAGWLARRR